MTDENTSRNPKLSVTRRDFSTPHSQRERYAMIRVLLLCAALFAGVASPILSNVSAAAHYPRGDWSWVTDTFWYVTQENLPAVATDLTTQQRQLVSDQTVWHIEDYSQGYFWGKTVVQLTGGEPLCLSMVGSITPEGDVQITFTLPLPGLVPGLSLKTSGSGRMWSGGALSTGLSPGDTVVVPERVTVGGNAWKNLVAIAQIAQAGALAAAVAIP